MLKKKTKQISLIMTVLLAVLSTGIAILFFKNPNLNTNAYFHMGIDMLGTFVCAVLFYGCMEQIEVSTRSFSALVLMESASFAINELMWFFKETSKWRDLYFVCCLSSKWLNLAMIYCFYLYVRNTLDFKGKTAAKAFRLLCL